MTIRDLLYEKIENSPAGSVIDITCPVLCWNCRAPMTVNLQGLTVLDSHVVSVDQDGMGRLTRQLLLPREIRIVCDICGYVNERYGKITIITPGAPMTSIEGDIFHQRSK